MNPIGIERKRYLLIDCLGVYDHPLLLLLLCSLLSLRKERRMHAELDTKWPVIVGENSPCNRQTTL